MQPAQNTGLKLATDEGGTADKLLSSVCDLMIEKESVDVSLAEIAARAGVNSALVKYHFGNKEGLYFALLARIAAAEMGSLDGLLDMPVSASAKMRLHISGIMKTYYRFPFMNALFHYLRNSGTTDQHPVSDLFVNPLVAFYRKLLAQGVASGEFRDVDPLHFYAFVFGATANLFSGRPILMLVADVGPVTKEECREYARLVEAGVFGVLGRKPD